MDTTTLRWILLILGLLLLAGIYVWGRYQPLERLRDKRRAATAKERSEPVLDPQAMPAPADEADTMADAAQTGTEPARPEAAAADEVVIIRIVGRQGAWLRGPDICMAADRTGLVFHQGLFHRMLELEQGEEPWYSLANVQEPGTFDLDQAEELLTPAVLLYFSLPNRMGALDSFDAMLATAERLAELLDGRLLDADGNALARQGVVHLRERMRVYDREHA